MRYFSAEFGGSDPFEFFKLPHKMNLAPISAEGGKRVDAHIAVGQIKLCKLQPRVYHIDLRRNGKKLFIQMLKIGHAQIEGACHGIHGPGDGGIIIKVGPQL